LAPVDYDLLRGWWSGLKSEPKCGSCPLFYASERPNGAADIWITDWQPCPPPTPSAIQLCSKVTTVVSAICLKGKAWAAQDVPYSIAEYAGNMDRRAHRSIRPSTLCKAITRIDLDVSPRKLGYTPVDNARFAY